MIGAEASSSLPLLATMAVVNEDGCVVPEMQAMSASPPLMTEANGSASQSPAVFGDSDIDDTDAASISSVMSLTEEIFAPRTLMYRLLEEKQLLWRQAAPLALVLLSLIYFALILFRNLAFFRYVPGPRLRDAGFEVFPEMSKDVMKYSDVPMLGMFFLDGLVLFGAFLGPELTARLRDAVMRVSCCSKTSGSGVKRSHPHLVNLLRRMLSVYAIGHMLRGCTYLATTIPGSANHCLPGAEMHPPTSLLECFYKVKGFNGNCGDLIFSGHCLFLWLSLAFFQRYGAACWGLCDYGNFHKSLLFTGLALSTAQIVLILMSRHHYTVDIVVASYTTPMLWFVYCEKLQPLDMRVNKHDMNKEIGANVHRPYWQQVAFAAQTVLGLGILVFLFALIAHGNFKWLSVGDNSV